MLANGRHNAYRFFLQNLYSQFYAKERFFTRHREHTKKVGKTETGSLVFAFVLF